MTTQTHIATGLAKIGLFLRAESWRQADAAALTPTQAQILAHLTQRGPARITALAEARGAGDRDSRDRPCSGHRRPGARSGP